MDLTVTVTSITAEAHIPPAPKSTPEDPPISDLTTLEQPQEIVGIAVPTNGAAVDPVVKGATVTVAELSTTPSEENRGDKDDGKNEDRKDAGEKANEDGGASGATRKESQEPKLVDVEEIKAKAFREARNRPVHTGIVIEEFRDVRRPPSPDRRRIERIEVARAPVYGPSRYSRRRSRRRSVSSSYSSSLSSVDRRSRRQSPRAARRESKPIEDPITIPQLNRVPWDIFYGLRIKENGAVSSPFTIDVLDGDPEPEPSAKPYFDPGGHSHQAAFLAGMSSLAGNQAKDIQPSHHPKPLGDPISRKGGPMPERIRINSHLLVRILSKIVERSDSSFVTGVPILMMQPFRALVYHKDDIRSWRTGLEARLKEAPKVDPTLETDTAKESQGGQTPEVDVGDKEEEKPEAEAGQPAWGGSVIGSDGGDDSLLESQRALDDLNCLIEFIETDLESRLARLVNDDCDRVAFSDIWHIFKPGDAVLGGKQAYRVVSVKYPKHKMLLPTPADFFMFGGKARLEDNPMAIHCVHIDSDGEKIGPVPRTFTIPRFEGEKSIMSLDIIPLRLAEKAGGGSIEEALVKRAATFIQACGTGRGGVPMHYAGLTLDTEEEVDSQVVIDFEEAFAANDGGGKAARRTNMTFEEGLVDLITRELRDKVDQGTAKTPAAQEAQALRWKPIIGRVDTRGLDDSDTEGYSRTRRSRDTRCIPECCSGELVHNDTYVERNLRSQFIQSQFSQQRTESGLRMASLAISPRPLKEMQDMEVGNFITDAERLIVSYRVFGFIMRSRKWAKLDLTYLGSMKGENTFDLLVLPPGHRKMVESLVTQHYLDRASAADGTDEVDLVRGKGKGLILLLHGAPGVGKTTTAECVATYFHKPLFQITCGDLGSTAEMVETRLETNFALASRWGCILLIDEADVFLEARQTENFDRNSLVAVFLRTLEYYTGILFLTTNRVGTFDEAFTSRIHISLYYPPLSQASTLAVFKVNIDRIKERFLKKKEAGVAELDLDERSIDTFVLNYYTRNPDARWNGRQIRNACQTALALAEFEAQKRANPGVAGGRSVMEVAATSTKTIKVRMTAKHFKDVARAYLAFMKYLRDVHGGVSPEQRAKEYRLRHDKWGLGEKPAVVAAAAAAPAPAAAGAAMPPGGLLASRRTAFAEKKAAASGGLGRKMPPAQPAQRVKQQVVKRRVIPQVQVEEAEEFGEDDEHFEGEEDEEDDLGEFGYGEEEDVYGQENEEDPMVDEEEGGEEEDAQFEEDPEFEHEEEGYPEEDEDDGALDDVEGFGAEEEEQEEEEADYVYEEPKPKLPPAGLRGVGVRGRGQPRTRGSASNARAGGLVRTRGSGTNAGNGAGRQYSQPEAAPRASPVPRGSGRGRAKVSGVPGIRGRRGTARV